MQDRTISGGIAGCVGSLFCSFYEVAAERLLGINHSFLDYTATLVSYHVQPGLGGFTVGFLAQMAVGIIFGVVFTYLLALISSDYLLIKGLGYGFALWLMLSGFGVVYNLPLLRYNPPAATLFDLSDSLLYGLVTAYVVRMLRRHAHA